MPYVLGPEAVFSLCRDEGQQGPVKLMLMNQHPVAKPLTLHLSLAQGVPEKAVWTGSHRQAHKAEQWGMDWHTLSIYEGVKFLCRDQWSVT